MPREAMPGEGYMDSYEWGSKMTTPTSLFGCPYNEGRHNVLGSVLGPLIFGISHLGYLDTYLWLHDTV